MNKLYRGTFNYSGETRLMYTQASSPEKAFLNFCSQLSKWAEVGKRSVMMKFDGSKDNYFIEEVKE